MRAPRDRVALLGLVVITASVLLAAVAPALAPADPVKNDLLARLTPPMWMDGGSAHHPLGTDTLGRDVVSRLLYGARVSLVVGFSAVILAGALGVVLGLVAGYYGGRIDDALMRLGDVQLAFPALVLAIAVLAVVGSGLGNVVLVLGVTGWVTYARIARGETLSLRHREFVEGARALGARDAAILWRHVLPNVLPALLDAVGPVATALLAGSFAAERVFGLPYFGQLYVLAVLQKQVAVVVVTTTTFAAMVAAVGLGVELVRVSVDPRVREGAQ